MQTTNYKMQYSTAVQLHRQARLLWKTKINKWHDYNRAQQQLLQLNKLKKVKMPGYNNVKYKADAMQCVSYQPKSFAVDYQASYRNMHSTGIDDADYERCSKASWQSCG